MYMLQKHVSEKVWQDIAVIDNLPEANRRVHNLNLRKGERYRIIPFVKKVETVRKPDISKQLQAARIHAACAYNRSMEASLGGLSPCGQFRM